MFDEINRMHAVWCSASHISDEMMKKSQSYSLQSEYILFVLEATQDGARL